MPLNFSFSAFQFFSIYPSPLLQGRSGHAPHLPRPHETRPRAHRHHHPRPCSGSSMTAALCSASEMSMPGPRSSISAFQLLPKRGSKGSVRVVLADLEKWMGCGVETASAVHEVRKPKLGSESRSKGESNMGETASPSRLRAALPVRGELDELKCQRSFLAGKFRQGRCP